MKIAGTLLLPVVVAGLLGAGTARAQQTTFSAEGNASAQTEPEATPPAATPSDAPATTERDLLAEGTRGDDDKLIEANKEWKERESKLNESATLTGGIGLLHTQHADGGAAGQFRVGFTTEYFSAGFLCSNEHPCRDPRNPNNVLRSDSADHIGGRLTLSMQVLRWLDVYLATSALANSNPSNRPSLLQVLGDSTMGAKAHGKLSNVFSVGGAFELWLVNGTGSVGLDGAGTSAKFRGLATADLRGMEKRIPLRFSTNFTYVLDNSGEVVANTEGPTGRNEPITRIERFGLNINRVDHFDIHFGAELFAAEEKVRPFIEYHLLIPVNRQDYRCRPNNPSNDGCLATDPFAPSTFTLGGRFFPWKQGFNLLAALDIGVSGVNTFIEEMRPTPPWMLYLGAGWAFDTHDKPMPAPPPAPPPDPARGGRRIRGFVHEEGNAAGIANAIVAWDNHPELTSYATGSDGRFTTHELPGGQYVFSIHADGYKPAQCTTTIGGASSQPSQSTPAGDVQLDCIVVALPRVGTIVGKVKDLDSGKFMPNVPVKIVDVGRKEFSGVTDDNGAFRYGDITPGEATVTIDADGYLISTEKLTVKAREDNPIEISIKLKPKKANVTVGKREVNIRQQIQFAVDSATILPASTGLLTEIADVLVRNPRIKLVEVQGHTDGTGTAARNMKLSDDRAAAVVSWLTAHGVEASRLTAKGYGDTKPMVPNVTELNRQRNRRVQFVIKDQDPDSSAPAAPEKKPAGKPKGPTLPTF
ncbi:MAG: carboxypeptidase regulatory-like domain-containing protein [Labilithrix sp.]|nr:carboxypeptidase regulatory-like domain-containing protein [Labilithrix sp.]MCW5816042.1 carboxypeptidase regulatory-like domain-containing protein [Labilithrix sp.]